MTTDRRTRVLVVEDDLACRILAALLLFVLWTTFVRP